MKIMIHNYFLKKFYFYDFNSCASELATKTSW